MDAGMVKPGVKGEWIAGERDGECKMGREWWKIRINVATGEEGGD
jgi:hypothetical protein